MVASFPFLSLSVLLQIEGDSALTFIMGISMVDVRSWLEVVKLACTKMSSCYWPNFSELNRESWMSLVTKSLVTIFCRISVSNGKKHFKCYFHPQYFHFAYFHLSVKIWSSRPIKNKMQFSIVMYALTLLFKQHIILFCWLYSGTPGYGRGQLHWNESLISEQ